MPVVAIEVMFCSPRRPNGVGRKASSSPTAGLIIPNVIMAGIAEGRAEESRVSVLVL